MADGPYCDFSNPMDAGMMPSIGTYPHRGGADHYDASAAKNGPGFYQDQYSNHPASGSMESYPGYSDDDRDIAGSSAMQSMAGAAASTMMAMQQHLLAKPVPMRRLSEKRIAQARACLGSMSSVVSEPLYDSGMPTGTSPALARALQVTQQPPKRPRSEKKAIPADLKDNKYFERRTRNNVAAKKSRDCRKSREDEIAIRASFLEKENAILRAQVATLRDEANSLRSLLLTKRSRP